MKPRSVTRREFMRESLVATAALTASAAVIVPPRAVLATEDDMGDVRKTRNFNPDMEYRRLGQTGLWVSAVCLGGHWKRVDKAIGAQGELNPYESPTDSTVVNAFEKNRREVVDRCLEVGINLVDLAGNSEVEVYTKALGGQREKMYLSYSHPASELREPENRTAKKLLELFEAKLKQCRLEYVDIWRLMALERGGQHSQADVDAMITALETARKQGKCRFTGFSTHDRNWAKKLIDKYPDILQVLCFPYTAGSKELPSESLFDSLRKYDVGTLGIKPFSSNALFKGDGSANSPDAAEDSRMARITLRYILNNPRLTAPIPGLASPRQVDNAVLAIKERRQQDLTQNERTQLDQAVASMWGSLSPDYHWLKAWEYV
jgi:predicted aldo/keto reductase-like oxidoreductase